METSLVFCSLPSVLSAVETQRDSAHGWLHDVPFTGQIGLLKVNWSPWVYYGHSAEGGRVVREEGAGRRYILTRCAGRLDHR